MTQAQEINYQLFDQYGQSKSYQPTSILGEEKLVQGSTTTETALNLSIVDEKVFSSLDDKKISEIGRVIACDGFKGKCLVIDELFSFILPSNFELGNASSWNWKGFDYSYFSDRKYRIFGKSVEVGVIVIKKREKSDTTFIVEYSEHIGIVSFYVYKKLSYSKFMLADEKGFLAK